MLAISRATATFCWLPPDSAPAERAPARRRERRTPSAASAPDCSSVPRGQEPRGWRSAEDRYSRRARFSASVEVEDQATELTVLRDVRHAGFSRRAHGRPRIRRWPPIEYLTRHPARAGPAIACTSSSWPLPSTPAMATTSPPRTVERHALPRPPARAGHARGGLRPGAPARRAWPASFSTRSSTSRPTISRARLSALWLPRWARCRCAFRAGAR